MFLGEAVCKRTAKSEEPRAESEPANSEWRTANGEPANERLRCDPRGQPPAGRTCSVTGSTLVAQTLAQRSRRCELIADRRSARVLLEAVLRLGRNEPQLRMPRPAQARLPSLRSVAFRKRNRRVRARGPLPYERVAIAGCSISACLAAPGTWLDPSSTEDCLACALNAWQDASRLSLVTSANAGWAVQFMCIAEDSCAGLCKKGVGPRYRNKCPPLDLSF